MGVEERPRGRRVALRRRKEKGLKRSLLEITKQIGYRHVPVPVRRGPRPWGGWSHGRLCRGLRPPLLDRFPQHPHHTLAGRWLGGRCIVVIVHDLDGFAHVLVGGAPPQRPLGQSLPRHAPKRFQWFLGNRRWCSRRHGRCTGTTQRDTASHGPQEQMAVTYGTQVPEHEGEVAGHEDKEGKEQNVVALDGRYVQYVSGSIVFVGWVRGWWRRGYAVHVSVGWRGWWCVLPRFHLVHLVQDGWIHLDYWSDF